MHHDQGTLRHCLRVAEISLLISKQLNLAPEQVEKLGRAAMYHDIGKIYIPKSILYQKGTLTPSEWKIIQQHPIKGAEIINQEITSIEIIQAVLHHHEHYNGKGYPHGLAGKNIPLFARIIAIADAYDAMTSTRPYRHTILAHDLAFSEIQIHAGTQFDPEICHIIGNETERNALNGKIQVSRL